MNRNFQRVEADLAISITDLKKNPNAVFEAAESQPVAVLNHNRVVGYVISPIAWEGMLERLDDLHIIAMLEGQKDEPIIPVSLDELSGPIRRKRTQKLEQARVDRAPAVRESASATSRKSPRPGSQAPRQGAGVQDKAS